MNIQNELEDFLSSARTIVVTHDGTGLFLWFGKEQLQRFSDPRNYEMLHVFFAARRITLLVYRRHPSYTMSLVDMDSGETLNISRVVFTRKLNDVFGKIPASQQLEFDILGMSADNRYVLEPPDIGSQERMMLHGYKIV